MRKRPSTEFHTRPCAQTHGQLISYEKCNGCCKATITRLSRAANLPLTFGPAAIRASADLLRSHSLNRLRLEFPAYFHAGGLAAPPEFCNEIRGFLPIAPCGRTFV